MVNEQRCADSFTHSLRHMSCCRSAFLYSASYVVPSRTCLAVVQSQATSAGGVGVASSPLSSDKLLVNQKKHSGERGIIFFRVRS